MAAAAATPPARRMAVVRRGSPVAGLSGTRLDGDAEPGPIALTADDQDMPLRPTPGLLDRIRTTSDRDLRRRHQALGHALADLDRRAAEPDVDVIDAQLLVQVVRRDDYATFRAGRTRAWEGTPYHAHSWPNTLQAGAYGALLLPTAPGPVGPANGLHPTIIAQPSFASGTPTIGRTVLDLVHGLVTKWIANPPDSVAYRLAPPIVETIGRRNIRHRQVETFDRDWPLPTPDGI